MCHIRASIVDDMIEMYEGSSKADKLNWYEQVSTTGIIGHIGCTRHDHPDPLHTEGAVFT